MSGRNGLPRTAEAVALGDEISAAVAAATAGITNYADLERDEQPRRGEVVRLRVHVPDRVAAESSFLGIFLPRDAEKIARQIGAALGGRVSKTGLASWEVAVGEPPHLLSMGEVAQRAGLAESSVRTYRSRGTLPEPDMEIGSTPGWLAATIDEWIASLPSHRRTPTS